jgi:hypothetical protein
MNFLTKIMLALDRAHSYHHVALRGVSVKESGWLVEFDLEPKARPGMNREQRVAFFPIPGTADPAQASFNQICG